MSQNSVGKPVQKGEFLQFVCFFVDEKKNIDIILMGLFMHCKVDECAMEIVSYSQVEK